MKSLDNSIARFTLGAILVLIFLGASITACKKDETPSSPSTPDPADTIPPISGWTLVWHDEFDGPRIDSTKWEHEIGGHGWGNNELQYYTAYNENSYIDSGKLIIEARKEAPPNHQYTSARMRTAHRGDWTYGRFDIRAKLPYGQGLWPAIWLLPTDWVYGGWPASGEIDIMEMLGHETQKVYGTIHWSEGGHQMQGGNYSLTHGTFASEYHVFTLQWDTLGMKWLVDGHEYYSATKSHPFNQRFHMLLNVAVGGNWPGYPDETTVFPQRMFVDYVRVYRKAP